MNNDELINDLLIAVSSAKKCLNLIPESRQTTEYSDLINRLNIFLLKYCTHEIVEDYIDLTPEKSKYIKYCVHCMNTFDV
jgi:hypothetical protein